jgi:dethiobiotin synthetase
LRGLFITGTDTGVGKTVLAGSIVAALGARGCRVKPLKPVITGLDDDYHPDWPPDHELLARAAGRGDTGPGDVALITYGPAVSPHLAAELEHHPIDPDDLLAQIRAAAAPDGPDAPVTIVEGVGGLLVPLAEGFDVRALAGELGLPLVIAARPGLGTINHTLLTLESARSASLEVAGVVLTPWPDAPDEIERSNRATIERLGEVRVSTLPRIGRADFETLAAAGARLPLDLWLERADSDRAGG